MSKVELEAKVDALMDEINFLKMFFEAVRNAPCTRHREMVTRSPPGVRVSRLQSCGHTLVLPIPLALLTLLLVKPILKKKQSQI